MAINDIKKLNIVAFDIIKIAYKYLVFFGSFAIQSYSIPQRSHLCVPLRVIIYIPLSFHTKFYMIVLIFLPCYVFCIMIIYRLVCRCFVASPSTTTIGSFATCYFVGLLVGTFLGLGAGTHLQYSINDTNRIQSILFQQFCCWATMSKSVINTNSVYRHRIILSYNCGNCFS